MMIGGIVQDYAPKKKPSGKAVVQTSFFLPPVVVLKGEGAPSKSKVKPRKASLSRRRTKHGYNRRVYVR